MSNQRNHQKQVPAGPTQPTDEVIESRWKPHRIIWGKLDPPARYSRRGVEVKEWREDLALVLSGADWRAAEQGLVLADFECRHGKMAHDVEQVCECFEPMDVEVALRLAVERILGKGSKMDQGVAEIDPGVSLIGRGHSERVEV